MLYDNSAQLGNKESQPARQHCPTRYCANQALQELSHAIRVSYISNNVRHGCVNAPGHDTLDSISLEMLGSTRPSDATIS